MPPSLKMVDQISCPYHGSFHFCMKLLITITNPVFLSNLEIKKSSVLMTTVVRVEIL